MSMEAVKEMVAYHTYAHYKASGVEWLGEVPQHWNVATLYRCIAYDRRLTYGIVQAGPKLDVGIPYIRPADMTGDGIPSVVYLPKTSARIAEGYSRSAVSEGDIVMSIGPSFGKVAIARAEHTGANLTQGTARIAIDKVHHARYFLWLLRSYNVQQYWASVATGATFPALNLEPLGRTVLPIPNHNEQQKIATFLDRKCGQIDQAIAQKERLIALLKERRQVLVQQAVTKGLAPKAKMKDSGVGWLGEVPVHWEVRRLGTLGVFGKGRDIARGMTVPNGSPVILYGDLYTSFDVWTVHVVSFVGPEHSHMGTPIVKGDLVLAASGETREDIGKCAAYLGEDEPRLGGDALRLSLKDGDAVYMSFLLNSPGVVAEKVKLCKGEIIVHIYPSMLKRIFLPVPPPDEQKAIGRWLMGKVENERSAIKAAHAQIAKLKEYRSILINAAVTGKIKVPEV